MSTAAVELRPAAAPGRVGQATAVEQSRAVAEVQAAVIVAQQCPRSVQAAIEAMKDACAQKELADVAFFEYPRGKDDNGKTNTVSGPSVHLARELARCWGNVQHGITELARDDARGESEMQAWAWDVQTNTRSSNTFIVPHKRDTRKGVKELTDMRDIYENNANNGARRLREAIFSVLPAWYVARAEALCQQTIENGGGKPLAQRIADALKAFEKLRVSPARIAAKFGHDAADELTATDVAQLGVIYDSLKQGTVTVDDEFPPEPGRITPADLAPKNVPPAAGSDTAAAPPAPVPAEPAGGTSTTERAPALASTGQVSIIQRHFKRLGYSDSPDDKAARLRATARLAGYRGELASTKQLTQEQANRVREQIEGLRDAAALQELLDELGDMAAQEEASDGQ